MRSLTQEQALALFEYRNGELYWKNCVLSNPDELTAADKRHFRYAGRKAGTGNGNGYLTTSYRKKRYYIHHLVFLMFHGYRPKLLDHINGVRDDNRIENLREVCRLENARNKGVYKANRSGYRNVSHLRNGKYEVSLRIQGKRVYVGVFDDAEFAGLVAEEARTKYHANYVHRKARLDAANL
jgi:hypothetical protein